MSWASGFATLGGLGHMRPAPGTWGSAAALPLAWVLHTVGGFWLFFVASFAVAAIGHLAIAAMTDGREDADLSEIIIDEVVGQWIALWPVSFGAMFAGTTFLALWPGIVTAFVAFRLFDIWKPGPVGYVDGMKGPLPVMLDDVVAGWLAAMVVVVVGVLAHAVFI